MLPERPAYPTDEMTREVLDLIARRFGNHFGSLENFDYPVTRAQGLGYLCWFVAESAHGSYLVDLAAYERNEAAIRMEAKAFLDALPASGDYKN